MRVLLASLGLLLLSSCSSAPAAPGPKPLSDRAKERMAAIEKVLPPDLLKLAQTRDRPLDISVDKKDQAVKKVVVSPGDPARGPADAAVTIVVFSDFQCPFCAKHARTMQSLEQKYSGLVRVVFKQFPLEFHQHAMPLALASLCAREKGRFWQFHDFVFENKDLDDAGFQKWAADNGLVWDDLMKCVESERLRPQVEADLKQGQSVGVSGTPSSFINGFAVVGAMPAEGFDPFIQVALARAYLLMRKGVEPENVYAALIGE